jgi:NTF2 fold immunity protein
MKSNVTTWLLIPIFLGVTTCGQQKQTAVLEKAQAQSTTGIGSKQSESVDASTVTVGQPKNGYVPDEQTAIAIAVAVWTPIYGKAQIENEKPYTAKLSKGVWTVQGTLPAGYDGGSPLAEISQEDGRILKVIHYQ